MENFSGKTALVIGGTRGIGGGIVSLFRKKRCKVFYTGTSRRSDDPHYLQLDLTDKASVKRFVDKVRSICRIDILINNAGINMVEPIYKLSDDKWEKILAVNLTGVMRITREVSKLMIKKGLDGKIVNISSILGVISKSGRASYSASKTGLIGLTRASALDLAPYNIAVNALCPGFISTDLTESILSAAERKSLAREVPLGRFGTVSEMAHLVAFLCSDLNTYMTGQTIIADGGFTIR